MDRELAAELMDEIIKVSNQLNVVIHKIEVLSGDELLAMRQHLGQVMAAHDKHLFRPIVKQYPDLDPHL